MLNDRTKSRTITKSDNMFLRWLIFETNLTFSSEVRKFRFCQMSDEPTQTSFQFHSNWEIKKFRERSPEPYVHGIFETLLGIIGVDPIAAKFFEDKVTL